jgi:hypothetical protein
LFTASAPRPRSIPDYRKHAAPTLFEDTGVAEHPEKCVADLIIETGQFSDVGDGKL